MTDDELLPEVGNVKDSFDAIKRMTKTGIEYWHARDLQNILGYARWETFEDAIKRARQACESAGVEPRHHFADVTKKVSLGSRAERGVRDYALTRNAAYLIAMNGDPSKPEIAAAQAYFAVQTRRKEKADTLSETEARIELRDRLREDVKELGHAAKDAGVERFGLFHDAGYR